MKLRSLSIFLPAYNDEHTIGVLVKNALRIGGEVARDYEVIVIDDGSRDNTGRLLDGLARDNDKARVIHHTRNIGYGGALRSGFREARKEWIFYTDGDAQYDVKELKRLIPFTDRADVINGYKRMRADTLLRRVLGRIYQWTCRFLFNIRLRDIDCDFRLIKSSLIKNIHLVSNGGTICVEIIRKLQDCGARFYQVPVSHYPRKYGRSQFLAGFSIFIMAKEIIDLWMGLFLFRKR